ncbi:sensor histidine kinase [Aurantimonas sp. C2-6-R+9]|uniref:sensor histidine kinase n=1 Tax=unclassified Aurantimonas TaxID=2638230 RepID=UPI002E1816CD|nr:MULTISPECIES: sensor histidine kinase [unclassified Aurantimonas]MEC5289522.1 sensor histidine kinase [Aurantimonas sp. C2-3-R2]MEC5323157.1 sensor histidine kinase [Aurantimonas sp. A3-2-R12]MEC5379487.1 sensor histidine kinase [Aurantimonas sp. C2-6-R+9]MEC5410603.1 sensor histidine kinase [Aurantimonas sp. C2-4-R8]
MVSIAEPNEDDGGGVGPKGQRREAILRKRLRRLPLIRRVLYQARRLLGHTIFSSLTRRIVFLNLVALIVLVSGILYLNQFRAGLIDARVESLLTQGEIIASAIASSATVETNSITLDPERLLELQAGDTLAPSADITDSLEFPINPERVAPLLRRLISPTRTRARLYDRDANLILDSRHLYSRGQILRYNLPPVAEEEPAFVDAAVNWFRHLFQRSDLPIYRETPGGSGAAYPEVMNALTGGPATVVRATESAELIVSVAVPIQRFRAVLGVLLLSTQGGDIDKIVQAERMAIVRVFAVAAIVTIVLSILLASTIATPLRRLSAAAIRVRRGVDERAAIPDFGDRADEVGNLATALRDMTNALYARMDAIESFAADVSHELKNPLTSLRSAVETLPLARTETSKKRLLEIIQHDVRRLDRLITDIADASRLDAELARQIAQKVDLAALLRSVVDGARGNSRARRDVKITFEKQRLPASMKRGYVVTGHDLRLGQVFTNLIENARSFVPETNGRIDVLLRRRGQRVVVTIEDNGPGIQAEIIDRIFERFYTDRPAEEDFGQNSGLGLSISRQIVEAHGGTLRAENIEDGDAPNGVAGARFTVSLPAE